MFNIYQHASDVSEYNVHSYIYKLENLKDYIFAFERLKYIENQYKPDAEDKKENKDEENKIEEVKEEEEEDKVEENKEELE